MFHWINKAVVNTLSCLPKWSVKPFASAYVAGETADKAIDRILALNKDGYCTIANILGEHVRSKDQSYTVRDAYCRLLERIAEQKADSTISLKLTHLGLGIDPELALSNTMTVVGKAREHGNALTLDMENSRYTDAILDIYKECARKYDRVAVALQAYLHRSMTDLEALASPSLHLRICKGIYNEPAAIAFKVREEIRQNYIEMAKTLLRSGAYACLATHDPDLIDSLVAWIQTENISNDRFEFQVLHGVPMGGRLERLKSKGYTVRVYVPFGKAWFDYSMRRLKENPHILWYVLRNLLKRA